MCTLDDLLPERGAAALVDGEQVALFRLAGDTVLAVQQRDPFSGANVMSRGVVGNRGGRITVASPMYKQVFDLETGECIDDLGSLPVPGASPHLIAWSIRVDGGAVHVGEPVERRVT
ncbi:nitrite reductase small subunit NirD [Georgenia sp. Z1491]|uniref:nitrite reductase small subunit NirD n=1 Tax=Georgenia sp. Z1491 TaxID=3416707 RepID=UPI003CE96D0B